MCIGAAIEENQEDHYISKKSGAKAREVLVMIWLLAGFLLTISYKSVLRSNLIYVQYEKPIDSVEEFLKTDKQIYLDGTSALVNMMAGDRRQKMIEMNKRIKHYKAEGGSENQNSEKLVPSWISKG